MTGKSPMIKLTLENVKAIEIASIEDVASAMTSCLAISGHIDRSQCDKIRAAVERLRHEKDPFRAANLGAAIMGEVLLRWEQSRRPPGPAPHPLTEICHAEIASVEANARAARKRPLNNRHGIVEDLHKQYVQDHPDDKKVPAVASIVANLPRRIRKSSIN